MTTLLPTRLTSLSRFRITAGDIRVDGGTVVAETVALSSDGLQATFNVQANDDSVADLVVTVKDTVTDLTTAGLLNQAVRLSQWTR